MYKKITALILIMLLSLSGLIYASAALSDVIGTIGSDSQYSQKVFSQSRVNKVDIVIDGQDWQEILENPMEEEYHTCDVTVNGTTIRNVAIRTKGNNSLTTVASSESDRYSFKIDFDYYDNNLSLYGLKKLNLNNNVGDATYMREYLSYKLMEEMGIPTPCYAYMWITINGEDWGLYTGVEAVDETFIQANFSDMAGDLYKPDGTTLSWSGDDISSYSGLYLKTNEGTSDQNAMINFLDVINNGGDLNEVMDVDEFIRYFAANTALVSLDSYQGDMLHNYYLYEQDGVFSIIPWDYNYSFGVFMGGGRGGRNQRVQGDQQTESERALPDAQEPSSSEESDSQQTALQTSMSGQQQPDFPGNGTTPPGGQGGEGGNLPEMDGTTPDGSISEDSLPDDFTGQQDGEDSSSSDQPEGSEETQDGSTQENTRDFGGMNGGMMMGNSEISDTAVNFSIDTPVSGGTLESRPMINCWLSDETYKETYYSYLEEIANGFMSEERMTVIVGELADLIGTYVQADPTAFFTYDEHMESLTGENGIIEFSKQRSESIIKQLNGEEVETFGGTESGFTWPSMDQGGMFPSDETESQDNAANATGTRETVFEDQQLEGLTMLSEGQTDGAAPPTGSFPAIPDGEQFPMPDGEMPDGGQFPMPGGEMPDGGQFPMPDGQDRSVRSVTYLDAANWLILVGVLTVSLFCIILFVKRFERRKWIKM